MILLGVDPGLLRMGYGVIEVQGSKARLREGGTIQGGPPSTPLEERLLTLYDGIREVVTEYNPEALALEELYSHYAYPNTAVVMGHARGVVCLAAAQGGGENSLKARDRVAAEMTPADVSTAQRMAREWLAKHGKTD